MHPRFSIHTGLKSTAAKQGTITSFLVERCHGEGRTADILPTTDKLVIEAPQNQNASARTSAEKDEQCH
jgi:hypothetical protein